MKKYGRLLLAALGLLAIVFLVRNVGAAAVWSTMVGAGMWLPLILVLDFSWMAIEGIAVLFVYGEGARKIRPRDWLRATLVHFAAFVFVPVGRASAEVARATLLAPRVGKSRATAGAAVMQSMTLTSNALMSALSLLALTLTVQHAGVAALLGANVLLTGGLGVAFYLVLRHVRLGGFLGRRFKKLALLGPEVDAVVTESRDRHFHALLFTFLGRCVQAAQYGVILYAVVGASSVAGGLIAEGIQLMGRSAGDAVPSGVGVVETAFTLGAGALSLAGEPDKAISIALLGRLSNVLVAGLCALVLQLLPARAEEPADEPVLPE